MKNRKDILDSNELIEKKKMSSYELKIHVVLFSCGVCWFVGKNMWATYRWEIENSFLAKTTVTLKLYSYNVSNTEFYQYFDEKKKIEILWRLTCMAVRAATIAGLPKPCDMSEKCVSGRCMIGSRMCWGLVLHSGERSWFSKSISSLVTCLCEKKKSWLCLGSYF